MKTRQRRAVLVSSVTLLAAGLLNGLPIGSALAQQPAPVKVGSKIDTEGKLLGSMLVLVLESNGIKVEN